MTSVDGIAALRACYDRLQRVTGNTLPFALHEWHVTWCRHFLNRNPRIADEPYFQVLRDAGGCVAIFPFIISRRRVGPLKIVSIELLGADPAITEIRTPLIDPGYDLLATRIVQHRMAELGGWDWIHWSGITGASGQASAGGRLQPAPTVPDFVLDLAPSWEEFRGRLKRNIRESLRHCYNSLKRDSHSCELRVIEEVGDLRRGLEQFFRLHLLRANSTAGVAHPDRFASRVSRDFLYDVCEGFCKRGALRLFQLEVDTQVVAMRLGFVVGDSLYLYYSGFDPAWSRYGVMTTTMAEAIKYAITHGIKTVNLSTGKDVAKTRWGPRQVDYPCAYEEGARLRSHLAHQAYVRASSGAGVPSWVMGKLIPRRRHWN